MSLLQLFSYFQKQQNRNKENCKWKRKSFLFSVFLLRDKEKKVQRKSIAPVSGKSKKKLTISTKKLIAKKIFQGNKKIHEILAIKSYDKFNSIKVFLDDIKQTKLCSLWTNSEHTNQHEVYWFSLFRWAQLVQLVLSTIKKLYHHSANGSSLPKNIPRRSFFFNWFNFSFFCFTCTNSKAKPKDLL